MRRRITDAHPSGAGLRRFNNVAGDVVLLPVSVSRQTTDKTKGPVFRLSLSLLFNAWQFPTLT
ncbi:hypothetical protein NPQ29_24300, partial [Raoultella planticola]|uniref:hypothetical protein n=1 Tax=Raoultella planticola TaxID=575 RepID=UPI0021127F73